MSLAIRPTTLRKANAYVELHHRHHKPARGCVFCLSAWLDDALVGVVIVGRPLARMSDDGLTAEVTRCCTDGTRNACSKLYAAVARTAREMGFERVITYTLPSEGGASLRGAGWKLETSMAGGGTWSREGRERTDDHPTELKARWAA